MRIILASALLAAFAVPASATTFISGSLDAGAHALLGTLDNQDIAGGAVVAAPGSNLASANAFVSDGTYSVNSAVSSFGNWASADAGTVSISWGWTIAGGGSGVVTLAETNNAATNWSYTFTATGDGSFDGRYNVVGTGATFGLQSLYPSGNLGVIGSFGGNVGDPTSSGSFSVALVNGQTYTMSVFNYGNVSNGGGFDAIGNATADIDWQITYAAVPEPASWAMMITGFGMIGAATRRRRNTVTA